MLTGAAVPTAAPNETLGAAIVRVAHQRGTVAVLEEGRLIGILTAGDLTRFASRWPDFMTRPIAEAMNTSPKTASPDERAGEARARMEAHGIMALPVVQEEAVLGMVHLHDILRAGVEA